MNPAKLALISLLCLSCLSCGHYGPIAAPTTVQAQTPSQPTISLDCSAAGPVGEIDDGSGALLVNWGPCAVKATGNQPISLNNQTITYTLQNPIQARHLDAWLGTQTNSKLEIGYFLLIRTPKGQTFSFSNQLDKHQDVIGSQYRQADITLNLPAGTVLTMGLAVGITNPETDCPCGVQAQWTFNHGID